MNCASCGKRADEWHHVVYQQELRRSGASCADRDGMMPLCRECHTAHHSRSDPLPLASLNDAAYDFAVRALGRGPAYVYLRRRYRGADARLDALIDKGG